MTALKVAAVVLATLIAQVSFLARFSFDGARPDVLLLLAIVAGLIAGPEKGAIVGFCAGLAFDVVLGTPFGLSAFVYTLVGYVVGRLGANVVRSAWWITPVLVGLASAASVVLYALVGAVLGEPTLKGPQFATIVVVVASVNALLAPLAVRALRWTRTSDVDHRRHTFLAR